jgi:hypothetical protein
MAWLSVKTGHNQVLTFAARSIAMNRGDFTNKHRVLPMQIFTGKERDHLTHLFAFFQELQQWGFNH